jgi:hypothetical protein
MALKSQYEKRKAGHVLIIHHSGRSTMERYRLLNVSNEIKPPRLEGGFTKLVLFIIMKPDTKYDRDLDQSLAK